MTSNDKKSVPVPVRTVNLGGGSKPNEAALSEEDKEILGGFNVPLGKTGQQLPEQTSPPLPVGDRRQQSRELALARAREVKRQKYSKIDPQEQKQTNEPNPIPDGGDDRELSTLPLVETEPPIIPETNYAPIPVPDRNNNDTPSIISPQKRRRILEMLQSLSDEEDEPEAPPKKKPRTSDSTVKESSIRNFVADKAVDFGRFLVATTAVALLSGTVKAIGAAGQTSSSVGSKSSEWFRE